MEVVKMEDHLSVILEVECWKDGEWVKLYSGDATPENGMMNKFKDFDEFQTVLKQELMKQAHETGGFTMNGVGIQLNTFQAYRFIVKRKTDVE